MSATELIQQVAALPQQERALFEQLFIEVTNGNRARDQLSRSTWPDFTQRLQRIYGERVMPDSQSVIDEGRGDR